MVQKRLIVAERRRSPGKTGFGWIDRRLVEDGIIDALDGDQTRLYLFLVIVSDRDGLSFYGDRRVARSLRLTLDQLDAARRELQRHDLVAYRAPLYQVLSLPASPRTELTPRRAENPREPPPPTPEPRNPTPQPTALADILAQIAARAKPPAGGDTR